MNFMPHPDPSPERSEFTERTIGLSDLWGAMLRRVRVMLAAFLIVAVIVLAVSMLQPKLYAATAVVLITPGQEQVLGENQSLSVTPTNSATVDSEVEVLRSEQIARQVVNALELTSDAGWNAALASPSLLGQARALWTSITTTGGRRNEASADVSGAIARRLSRSVSIRRRALSFVVDITVTSRSAEQAALIANTYVQVYQTAAVASQSDTTERASGWLGQRLRELEQDLSTKEAAVAAYRAETGLLIEDGASLSEQQVREVQNDVIAARADLAEKQARYAQVRRLIQQGGSADSIGDALNSQVIRDLRREEAQLTRQQAELETQLGELHPDVVNGRNQIADIRAQIAAEVRRILLSLNNEVEVARARLSSLESTLGSASGEAASNGSAEVRLQQLQREAAASRAVYESFLQRFHEIAGQGQFAAVQTRLVSRATAPSQPSSPDLKIALVIALGCGLLAALGLGLGSELLNDAVIRADDLEGRVGAPALTSVPAVSAAALRLLAPSDRHPSGYLVEKPMSAYAEAFRVLRTSINFSSVDRRTQVVAVTSALPDEGKTTSALSLARIAAMSGQTVMLVDCDLRRHSLNALLDIEPQQGLLQVLAGEVDWRKVTGRDESTTIHILPAASTTFTPRDTFGSKAMENLLAELRANYDLVILDCPPVWAVAETRVIASKADATVLVARWGKTAMRAIANSVQHLTRADAHVIGVVVNCVDLKIAGRSGYSDPGYYAYASQKYYAA